MSSVHIVQYGCRLNQYEGHALSSSLAENGFQVSELTKADYIVFNTCTVTDKADKQSLYEIRRAKRQNPDAKIIVTGCFATTDKEELEQLPEIDTVFPNNQKAGILDFLTQNNTPKEDPFSYSYQSRINKTRISLKVQDGCNRSCSYCKIPMARGPAVSRSMSTIVDEAKTRIHQGYNEIVLTGVNMGWYKNGGDDFSSLLQNLCDLDGDFHIRLSSIEPGSLRERFFKAVTHPKIAKFAHVPLQSGDDYILRQMKRGYNTKSYTQRILELKNAVPNLHIGTDIIAGFPGETEAHFKNTVDYLQAQEFSRLHVFPYSSRQGTSIERKVTSSSVLPVVNEKITERVKELRDLSLTLEQKFKAKTADYPVRAVVEQKHNKQVAVTENYIKVNLPGQEYKPGDYLTLSYDKDGNYLRSNKRT